MVIALNPVSKSSKSGAIAHFGADIALVTANHPEYNGVERLSHGEREPFVINGPGDYEIKEIFIKGVMSEAFIADLAKDGASKKYVNTIYLFSVDGINIAFLGALGNAELSKESREALNNPDVLFIPVGGLPAQAGKGMLDAKTAAKFTSSLEPKLIVPMDYDDASLKVFLKELGEEKAEVAEKLTLKRKDLDNREGEVVILSAT